MARVRPPSSLVRAAPGLALNRGRDPLYLPVGGEKDGGAQLMTRHLHPAEGFTEILYRLRLVLLFHSNCLERRRCHVFLLRRMRETRGEGVMVVVVVVSPWGTDLGCPRRLYRLL